MKDKEEYLRLVLYLSLADPGMSFSYAHKVISSEWHAIGMVGLETSIGQDEAWQFV